MYCASWLWANNVRKRVSFCHLLAVSKTIVLDKANRWRQGVIDLLFYRSNARKETVLAPSAWAVANSCLCLIWSVQETGSELGDNQFLWFFYEIVKTELLFSSTVNVNNGRVAIETWSVYVGCIALWYLLQFIFILENC